MNERESDFGRLKDIIAYLPSEFADAELTKIALEKRRAEKVQQGKPSGHPLPKATAPSQAVTAEPSQNNPGRVRRLFNRILHLKS